MVYGSNQYGGGARVIVAADIFAPGVTQTMAMAATGSSSAAMALTVRPIVSMAMSMAGSAALTESLTVRPIVNMSMAPAGAARTVADLRVRSADAYSGAFPGVVAPVPRITVRVYDRMLNFVGLVPSRTEPSFQDQLGKFGEGVGTFKVSANAPELLAMPSLIDYDNIVVMHDSLSNTYFPWEIEKRSRTTVASGDSSSDVITLSGRGGLGLLQDALMLSEDWSIDTTSKATTRATSFASKQSVWYTPSEWVPPAVNLWTTEASARKRNPKGWVDPQAYWMWYNSTTDPATPDGYCYFRSVLHLSGPSHVSMFTSADNAYDMWVDGAPVASGSSWKRFERVDLNLEAGDHVIGIRGFNLPAALANPAGVLFSCWTSDPSSGKLLNNLLRSDATHWLTRDVALDAPGWDPGDILKTFINEGKARGVNTAFAMLYCDWGDNIDSYGVPWDPEDRLNRSYSVGQELLTVARQLAESSCDLRVVWKQDEPDRTKRLCLQVFKKQGADRSVGVNNPSGSPVTFRRALNAVDCNYDGDNSGSKSALLIKTDLGWQEEVSAEYGAVRREGYVTLGSSDDAAMATAVATSAFEKLGPPAETITAKAIAVVDHVPFLDFSTGDYVLAPDSANQLVKTRVVGITLGEDADGTSYYTPAFSSIVLNRIVRATQWLKTMADGTAMGRLLNASPATPPEAQVPTMSNAYEVPFTFSGSLSVSTSPKYTPRDDGLLVELYVTLKSAGTTDTVLWAVKNGVRAQQVTLGAGLLGTTLDVNDFYSANTDQLQIEVATPGAGAIGLVVQARFN